MMLFSFLVSTMACQSPSKIHHHVRSPYFDALEGGHSGLPRHRSCLESYELENGAVHSTHDSTIMTVLFTFNNHNTPQSASPRR